MCASVKVHIECFSTEGRIWTILRECVLQLGGMKSQFHILMMNLEAINPELCKCWILDRKLVTFDILNN